MSNYRNYTEKIDLWNKILQSHNKVVPFRAYSKLQKSNDDFESEQILFALVISNITFESWPESCTKTIVSGQPEFIKVRLQAFIYDGICDLEKWTQTITFKLLDKFHFSHKYDTFSFLSCGQVNQCACLLYASSQHLITSPRV